MGERHESGRPVGRGLPGLPAHGEAQPREVHVRHVRGQLGVLHHAVQPRAVHHQGPIRQLQCLYGEKEETSPASTRARENVGTPPTPTDWPRLPQLLELVIYCFNLLSWSTFLIRQLSAK